MPDLPLLRIPPEWAKGERWGVGLMGAGRLVPAVGIVTPDRGAMMAAVASLMATDSEEWRAEREAMRDYL